MLVKIKALQNHAGFLRYFKNTSWMIAEQFLRIIAGLFVGIWVARYLGPEQFGLFSYAIAFTAIFGGIAKLGLDSIMVRELIDHPGKSDIYLGTAFWLKFFGAFLVIGIMAAVVPFTSNNATTNLYIFIIAAGLAFQSFEVVEFYFQSQVLAKIVSICKITQLALSSVIKIYLVFIETDLIYFVLVTAFDALSLAVGYSIAYALRQKKAFYKYFDPTIAKQLVENSWPLIFTAIVVMVYMRIDQIMITNMLGMYEAGIYSAAIKLSEAWYFIPTMITTSLFPALVNAHKTDKAIYHQRLSNLYVILIWGSIIVALFVSTFRETIITLLYGSSYKEASLVLMVHIWAGVFVSAAVLRGKWFVVENLVRYSLYTVVIGATLNIIMNYFLINLYGIKGAASATLLARILSFYLIALLFQEIRPAIKHFHIAIEFPFRYLRRNF